jgi:hypothetical protein
MIKYKIDIEKDHREVSVHYDLSVPVGGTELIATFQVTVGRKDVIKESASGNTRFFGTVYEQINEDEDVEVAFDLTSNQGFEATDTDTLRGGHPFESSNFSN